MTLNNARLHDTYRVQSINGNDKVKSFLLSLGCYEQAEITVVSKLGCNLVVNIQDGRYAIDEQVAKNIVLFC